MASVAVMTTLLLASVLRSMLTFLVMSSKPCHRILPVSYPCQLAPAKKRTKMKLINQNYFFIRIFGNVEKIVAGPSAECDILSLSLPRILSTEWPSTDGRQKNSLSEKMKHQVSVCVYRTNEDYYIKRAAVQCHKYQRYGIIKSPIL